MRATPRQQRLSPFVLFSMLAVLSLAAATWYLGEVTTLPVAWLAALNLITLLLYGYDKSVAGNGMLRVPELLLHLLALFGGSPAALLAQRMFRHKTRKRSFQRIFWLTVVLQLLLIGMLTARSF